VHLDSAVKINFTIVMAKILIAEDDTSMRKFLVLALEKAGHEVTDTGDGEEALAVLKTRQDFDLLLADIIMPGMDGIELSQKATDLVPALKVMFITGFAAVALNNKMTAPDAAPQSNKVLSKPFHLNELVTQVQDILAA